MPSSANQHGISHHEFSPRQSAQRPSHQALGPDQLSRKRRRNAENEEPTEHTCKSPRLQENLNKRGHNAENRVLQSYCKTPRLQEISDVNLQRVAQTGESTRSSRRTIQRCHCFEQEQSQGKRRSIRASKNCQNILAQASGAPVDGGPVWIRKRHRDQDDVERQSKRLKSGNYAQPSRASSADYPTLTSKTLKRLERQNHLQHLPSTEETALGQWEFINMSKSRKTETKSRRTEDTSSSTRTVSSTDPRFQKIAVKNGVLVPMQSAEPSNFDEIWKHLNRPRESVSPDLSVYKEYLFEAGTADNEDTVKQAVVGHLKKYNDGSYRSAFNQQFTEYPSNVGFNNSLSAPQPDLIQGINLDAFEPYPAKDLLGGSAIPTPSLFPITLAHMAGEFKRPGGNLIGARSQAAYDGASLVYGRNTARESMDRADLPDTAHVGSFVSDGTHVTTFAHYATRDTSGKLIYHQWPVTDTNIQLGHQNFKIGRRQLRNLQDWTRGNSSLLKEELLDHYKASQSQRNDQPAPKEPEENEFPEYGNGYGSAGNPAVVGSEPYVLIDRPTRPKSHTVLEAETSYITPKSSNSARPLRRDGPAPNTDISTRNPHQRHTRSSTRRARQDPD